MRVIVRSRNVYKRTLIVMVIQTHGIRTFPKVIYPLRLKTSVRIWLECLWVRINVTQSVNGLWGFIYYRQAYAITFHEYVRSTYKKTYQCLPHAYDEKLLAFHEHVIKLRK